MPIRRRENIGVALELNFHVDSIKSCVSCNKDIIVGGRVCGVFCLCRACIYCSIPCIRNDDNHHARCDKILQLKSEIESQTTSLRNFYSNDEILFDDIPHNDQVQIDLRNNMLHKRRLLVTECLQEGSRSGSNAGEFTNQNIPAYNIAIKQSLDLLLLRNRDTELVLNVHLLTGRFQELYNLCCYYSSTSFLGVDSVNTIWEKKVPRRNISRSFVTQKLLVRGYPKVAAICHVLIVKIMLHLSIDGLQQINSQFLDNHDCMNLIGEFVGLKKDWIINDLNHYQNQAFEIARLLHCTECYDTYDDLDWVGCFDRISSIANEYFPGKTSAIDEAIKIGRKLIKGINKGLKQDKDMTEARWGGMVQSYKADRELIYSTEIWPVLRDIVRYINMAAGWNAIGTNINPRCVSEFVTEATKACQIGSFSNIFDYADKVLCDQYGHPQYQEMSGMNIFDKREDAVADFKYALHVCAAIEQKLAQCYFHQNKNKEEVEVLLSKLPGGFGAYKSDPPVDGLDYPVLAVVEDSDIETITNNYPSDVEKLVSSLFKMGLATNDNLDLMFDKSGYVSYLIWKLQKQKEIDSQPSMDSFVMRNRLWKEGCIDNDKISGLKIKYLNKSDRSLRFEELRKLIPMGDIIQCLKPSIEQFFAKYRWSCFENCTSKYFKDLYWGSLYCGSVLKRPRCELDDYPTVEEACRHYFNTGSLEDAIWDNVGVPRIVVLNGDKEKMQKAGWFCCKDTTNKAVAFGDDIVKLGSRVAYVYSPTDHCTIWEELV